MPFAASVSAVVTQSLHTTQWFRLLDGGGTLGYVAAKLVSDPE